MAAMALIDSSAMTLGFCVKNRATCWKPLESES